MPGGFTTAHNCSRMDDKKMRREFAGPASQFDHAAVRADHDGVILVAIRHAAEAYALSHQRRGFHLLGLLHQGFVPRIRLYYAVASRDVFVC